MFLSDVSVFLLYFRVYFAMVCTVIIFPSKRLLRCLFAYQIIIEKLAKSEIFNVVLNSRVVNFLVNHLRRLRQ